jgi:hypothetical protein
MIMFLDVPFLRDDFLCLKNTDAVSAFTISSMKMHVVVNIQWPKMGKFEWATTDAISSEPNTAIPSPFRERYLPVAMLPHLFLMFLLIQRNNCSSELLILDIVPSGLCAKRCSSRFSYAEIICFATSISWTAASLLGISLSCDLSLVGYFHHDPGRASDERSDFYRRLAENRSVVEKQQARCTGNH